jgi:hypothetical protein
VSDAEFRGVFGPEWSKVNILADFTPSIHFYSFAFELRELKFDWRARVGRWDFELKFELIAN